MIGTIDEVFELKPNTLQGIVLDWIRTEFHLPITMETACDTYRLHVFTGEKFKSMVKDGMIGDYIIHWQSTPEVCYSAKQIGVSFRKYKERYYAVVKVWKGELA